MLVFGAHFLTSGTAGPSYSPTAPGQQRFQIPPWLYNLERWTGVRSNGALTREYDAVDPTVDKKLLLRLEALTREGAKTALITGRTERWLEQHLLPLIGEEGDFLVLGEYGDFRFWRGERSWDSQAGEFVARYREVLKDRIASVARGHGIAVKKDDRDYEPKSGELWFGPGRGVLSVRTNPNG